MPDTPRWGADDELGTLHYITDTVRTRALAAARTGRTVSLARAVHPRPAPVGPGAATDGEAAWQQSMLYTGTPPAAIAEQWTITPHHPAITHLDALSHIIVDGTVYPGVPVEDRVTPAGVTTGSTAVFGAGILTRGVFLDLAPGARLADGYPITARTLDTATRAADTTVQSGDAIVVRTGCDPVNPNRAAMPGLDRSAVAWLDERRISVWVGDTGDAWPPLDPTDPMPLHRRGLHDLGLPLVDSADLEALTSTCAETGRNSFLLLLAPPRIHGASGTPVNPIAVF
ncbi:cyclase family protein [Streptomyces mirabilis]|jgi:Predicted metal-dependent hydrolase|uniref:cyclase family protein n=1 Tax=Streptomyces mirabilis TaxID=68239 RepID=UPI000765D0C8|nr:cyclase family protein [Streptomyces mirabilis]MCX4428828.1 cyclase family protein [Streptomyces mirabilis]